VEHSEFNASQTEPAHLLQIWIQPDRLNAEPAYSQRAFDPAERLGRWALLAAPDGVDGALPIRQQASLRAARLGPGEVVSYALDPCRRYWLHVATGDVTEGERALAAGDALGFASEAGELQLRGSGQTTAEVLLFDLPA
ncbi:MAG TPA: quercetin 2,3-dioxygenase, partial [Xanthomonadaceae bacterium]|nr:quercetin 2,3-dioxygenase [Xanthomonadaceae bacterium]